MVNQVKHVCYVTTFEKTDESTLLAIINSRIHNPATMETVSDGWMSYYKLSESGYCHSAVVHKVEFVKKENTQILWKASSDR